MLFWALREIYFHFLDFLYYMGVQNSRNKPELLTMAVNETTGEMIAMDDVLIFHFLHFLPAEISSIIIFQFKILIISRTMFLL